MYWGKTGICSGEDDRGRETTSRRRYTQELDYTYGVKGGFYFHPSVLDQIKIGLDFRKTEERWNGL